MTQISQDLRYSLRCLWKNPGFAAVTVLTLGLGIGANSAIFSVLHAVLLRELPYETPDRLAVLWTLNVEQQLPDGSSFGNFRDWRDQSTLVEDMALYVRPEFTRATLSEADEPERIWSGIVGPNFFAFLGVPAAIGRTFSGEEVDRGERLVVISHGLWQRRFGGARDVVGRLVEIDGERSEIIGVMPRTFQLPTKDTELWQPIGVVPFWANRESHPRDADGFVVLGRLKPGVTFQTAQAEMDAIAARLRAEYPANQGRGVTISPLLDHIMGEKMRIALWLLFGAVVFVLLIACTNVANLLLARGALRDREFAVRTAMGAGRGRLAGQLLTESVLLAGIAGIVGLALAAAGIRALLAFGPGDIPRIEEIGIDPTVLAFTAAVSLIAGLLFGFMPAWRISRTSPQAVLKEGGARSSASRGSRRTHAILVVSEFALAVMLLCGAGLLIRSFLEVRRIDPGFRAESVLILQIDLPRSTYDERSKIVGFYREAVERIQSLPGVTAAGAVSDFFIHRQPDIRITVEGQPPPLPGEAAPSFTSDAALPGYFEAIGVPLLRGRHFTDADAQPDAPPVAVINETMERQFWPGEEAVGKRFKYGTAPTADRPWTTVVGVVGDMRRQGLEQEPISYAYHPTAGLEMDLAVRTANDPMQMAAAVRNEIRMIDSNLPVYGVATGQQRLGESVSQRQFETWLLGLFAATAALLASIGIYGLMHHSVASRTGEIGVRMALGADRGAVLAMIFKQGLRLAVAGIVVGIAGALALSRLVSSLLYGVGPADPLTYAGVSLLLVAVAALAVFVPARRATKVNPIEALRYE